MCEMFDSSFIDPFDVIDAPERLVNIATGAITPAGIEESLVAAIDKGTAMLNKFVKEIQYLARTTTGKVCMMPCLDRP